MFEDSYDVGKKLLKFLYVREYVLNINKSLSKWLYSVAGRTKRSLVWDEYMLLEARRLWMSSDDVVSKRKDIVCPHFDGAYTGPFDFNEETMNPRFLAKVVREKYDVSGWLLCESYIRPFSFVKDASLVELFLQDQERLLVKRVFRKFTRYFKKPRWVQRRQNKKLITKILFDIVEKSIQLTIKRKFKEVQREYRNEDEAWAEEEVSFSEAYWRQSREVMPFAYTLPYLESDLDIMYKPRAGIYYDSISEWDRETKALERARQADAEADEHAIERRKRIKMKKKKKIKTKLVIQKANFQFSKIYHYKYGVPRYKKYIYEDFVTRIKQAHKYEKILYMPKYILDEPEIVAICLEAIQIFMKQKIILELRCPVTIIGDIRGQIFDLLRYIDFGGFPPETNYLFLGNYISSEALSIETMIFLLLLKIKYPQNIFLLRGNRECDRYGESSGFKDECLKRYKIIVWKSFLDCFNCMPVAAIVCTIIFCCHGGISPGLKHVRDLRPVIRPTTIPEKGLVCDIIWSDPNDKLKTRFTRNIRQFSYFYSEMAVRKFLDIHLYQLLIRSHQFVKNGFKFQLKNSVLSLFSAPFIPKEFNNLGAVASFWLINATKLGCTFYALKLNTLECQINRFFQIRYQFIQKKRHTRRYLISKKKVYNRRNKKIYRRI